MKELALKYLYRQLKKARFSLGEAESKQNVDVDEIANLKIKIDVLEWLSGVAIKEVN